MSYNAPLVEQMIANGASGSRESNDALYPRVASGDPAAIRQMIESNMALVIDKVESYIRSYSGCDYLRDELISEGFLGLTVAVTRMSTAERREKPNPTGYISYWINYHIGAMLDKERASATGLSDRTIRNRKQDGQEVPMSVPLPEGYHGEEGIDPMSMVDLMDMIESCCETDHDFAIIDMRIKRYTDKEIAAALNLPMTTTYMMRRAIYDRFLEKSEMKGEV